MRIRLASTTDIETIANIHTESWRNTYSKVLTARYLSNVVPQERLKTWEQLLQHPKPNRHIVVAEHNTEVVGFACAHAGGNPRWGSYLDNLHVLKKHQSEGIGKALLVNAAFRCYQQKPDKGLCLLVNQDNVNAQNFYKRMGAHNAEESIWNAPDGSCVPTYWFVWETMLPLVETA